MTDHLEGYMAVFAPGSALDATTPSGYRNGSLSIPADEFDLYLRLHFPEIPQAKLRRGAVLRIAPADQCELRLLLDTIKLLIADPTTPLLDAQVRMRLEQSLRTTYLNAIRSGCGDMVTKPKMRIERRYLRMRQVRDYIDAHCHRRIHLDDLCLHTCLSRRGLENLFHDFLGTSVVGFLRHQRLHGARRALQNTRAESGTVKRIAFEWNFWHLGRFSHDYLVLFGESPSQTLAGGISTARTFRSIGKGASG